MKGCQEIIEEGREEFFDDYEAYIKYSKVRKIDEDPRKLLRKVFGEKEDPLDYNKHIILDFPPSKSFTVYHKYDSWL